MQSLLFVKEAPLAGPFEGTSGFAEQFQKLGPRDGKGRSVRELDLGTRLFRYRCSFLIYSDAFDALPQLAKEFVYRRLAEVLRGADTSADFAHLTGAERKAILEILTSTKPDFADFLAKLPT